MVQAESLSLYQQGKSCWSEQVEHRRISDKQSKGMYNEGLNHVQQNMLKNVPVSHWVIYCSLRISGLFRIMKGQLQLTY